MTGITQGRVLNVLLVAASALGLAACAAPQKVEAPDTSSLIWPLPPEQPRVKYIRAFRDEKDVEAEAKASIADILLGEEPEPPKKLQKPYGVHADKDGRIFVTDTGLGRLVVFDPANKAFSIWGEQGQGQLQKPIGVTSDSLGRVFVTDMMQKRVVVYDRDGNFLSAMGGKARLEGPAGIVVNEALGRVYVVDTKKSHIAVFDMNGKFVFEIGKAGTEPGNFFYPTNLALDREGLLYVMDTMNSRVQVLDAEGQIVKIFGELGDSPGQFARPKGIAVDSEGNIYVVDAAFNNFQIFNDDGQLLLFVGSLGPDPGQFWLPAGAYIDAQDRIYVVDQYNSRVQVFQFLGGDDGDEGRKAEMEGEPEVAEAPEDQEG
jgi:DNA-binding beta-propeller fold protein YncE